MCFGWVVVSLTDKQQNINGWGLGTCISKYTVYNILVVETIYKLISFGIQLVQCCLTRSFQYIILYKFSTWYLSNSILLLGYLPSTTIVIGTYNKWCLTLCTYIVLGTYQIVFGYWYREQLLSFWCLKSIVFLQKVAGA